MSHGATPQNLNDIYELVIPDIWEHNTFYFGKYIYFFFMYHYFLKI